jgi:ABC-type transporter Mla subunit MlaD
LNELHRLIARALKKTEAVWPELEQAYALVHQAAHVLANHENEKGQAVRERYQRVLDTMREQQASLGTLGEAIDTFVKVTESRLPRLVPLL